MQIPEHLQIKVKIARGNGDFTKTIEILTSQETFSQFKKKIEMLITGEVSQISWNGHPLDIKNETDLRMDRYLVKYLNGHPYGMTPDDLETTELNVAVQQIGGSIHDLYCI